MSEETSAPKSGLVPVQQRIIEWKDGMPVLSAAPVLDPGHVRDLYWVAAAQPYVPDPNEPADKQYEGLTIAEVMVRKQLLAAARSGDVEKVMDRLIGKAMSKSENLNVNVHGSYEDFLKKTAEKLGKIVEAEVVGEPPNLFGDLA